VSQASHEGGLGLERIVFLSDGVFAIAMTILVLEVRLPELSAGASNDELLDAILGLGPRLFAYALSFSILSLYWIAHWRRFGQIERADTRLAALNLLLLALIALIPFPTGLVGVSASAPAAVVFYAVTLAGAGIAGILIWLYADRAGLARADVPRDIRGSGVLRALVAPTVMLTSLVLVPLGASGVVLLTWIAILPLTILARPHRA